LKLFFKAFGDDHASCDSLRAGWTRVVILRGSKTDDHIVQKGFESNNISIIIAGNNDVINIH